MKVTFIDGGFTIGDNIHIVSKLDYYTLSRGIEILCGGTSETPRFNDEINLRFLIVLLTEKIIRDHCK